MARHREFLGGGDLVPPTGPIFIQPPKFVRPAVVSGRPGDELTTPPLGDSRGFVHRRIIGAVGGFIRGGPLGAAAGFLTEGRSAGTSLPRVQPTIAAALVPMRAACPPGFFETPAGGCQEIAPTGRVEVQRGAQDRRITETLPTIPFDQRADGGAPPRFGPGRAGGYAPDVREQFYRDCGPGAVLAKDGLCYNRRDLRNNERKWPRGRRPLLTGGEVRAISTAASAAKKLQRVQKRLMSLGLLPKPARRAAPKQLAPGHHAHIAHDGGSQH